MHALVEATPTATAPESNGHKPSRYPPPFCLDAIIEWADAFHARTGKWPNMKSGPIDEAPGDTWCKVHVALVNGHRSLAGGSSLYQLLFDRRGVRTSVLLAPELTNEQIVGWADAYHKQHGKWPHAKSGVIEGTTENWQSIDMALRQGSRGLPGGATLSRLLAKQRGMRNHGALPELSAKQVLAWADAYRGQTGRWPSTKSGPIPEAPGETWSTVNRALSNGRRGLNGGYTLAEFLSQHRRKRYHLDLPKITMEQVLTWVDAHHARTGQWPTARSGAIPEAGGLTWKTINHHLRSGGRGLAGGMSLPQLLARCRGARLTKTSARLSVRSIQAWARAHEQRTGGLPNSRTGAIEESPGDTWQIVDAALRCGARGLPGGLSLKQIMTDSEGALSDGNRPRLALNRIQTWMRAFHSQKGSWPSWKSGAVSESPGDTWKDIESALYFGQRGLPGGTTLRGLRDQLQKGERKTHKPTWTEDQVLEWADAYHEETGRWPTINSGVIPDAEEATWHRVNTAFKRGLRGLNGGTTLAQFLAKHRGLRPMNQRPRLSLHQIVRWAEEFEKSTGKWPQKYSGPIPGTNETWGGVEGALRAGWRGLPKGLSLFRLKKMNK